MARPTDPNVIPNLPTIIAISIFIATLTLVIWRPRGLGIGWSALLGAGAALATGVVELEHVPEVWGIVWNATFTLVAIIVTSLLLDEAGFFEWAALHMARFGGGNGLRLFALLVLLGAVVSGLFANDTAALVMTPIVMAMLLRLGFGPAATLAFVMAVGFVADTGSLPLVVSNLVNIISADYFGLGFGEYAAVMVPVNFVSVVASLLVLTWFFNGSIPRRYDVSALQAPASAITDEATFKAGWAVLAWLLLGFFGLGHFGVPVSAVAALGAAVLFLIARRGGRIDTRKVLAGAPWQVVLFSLGMYVIVYGLRNQGLTDLLAELLRQFAQHGVWAAALGTGVLTALLSSVMNNLPTVLIGALSVDTANAGGAVHQAMVYANVVGSDLGPKITPIGSLATLLWLHVLARKGVRVSWGYYFRVGLALTLPVLLATLAALAWRLA